MRSDRSESSATRLAASGASMDHSWMTCDVTTGVAPAWLSRSRAGCRCVRATGRGRVEKETDVVAVSQCVEGGGEDLVLEPEARRGSGWSGLLRRAPRQSLCATMENNVPRKRTCDGMEYSSTSYRWRYVLLLARADRENSRNAGDVGSRRDGGEGALMIDASARVVRREFLGLGRNDDKGADRRDPSEANC